MKTRMMKARAKLLNSRLRQAGLHRRNLLPLYTLQSKLQTVHSSSQMNHESLMTRNPRLIVTEVMMLSVPLLGPRVVLLAAPDFPGREMIVKRKIGSSWLGHKVLILVDRR